MPGRREFSELLLRLARRQSALRIGPSGSGGTVHSIVDLASGRARPVTGVAVAGFEEARSDGLLELLPDGQTWRLSRSGRAFVRRLRAGRPLAAGGTADLPRCGHGHRTSNAAPGRPASNDAESPLTWLARRADREGRRILDPHQLDAGERLRADLFFAQMTPRVTAPWSGVPRDRSAKGVPGAGLEMPDRIVAARQRVSRALEAVGPELSGILIDVCGHLKGLEQIEDSEGWPKRSAKLMLQMALTALARHYGLVPREASIDTVRRRLRHWGADDYRPTLDRWRGT